MKRICMVILAGSISTLSFAADELLVLNASKDTFARSNNRNGNNGASEKLVIARVSNIRSLIAFDLSSVTNEIVSAELRFRQHETVLGPVSLIVAPMVNTERNVAWGEGAGDRGVMGQNARLGEACYAFSAFRNVQWESATGKPLTNLSDSELWKPPVGALNGKEWEENRWVRIPIAEVSLLEDLKKSKTPTITFGVWGTSGEGLYYISSKNSPWPPVLHLKLKEEKKK